MNKLHLFFPVLTFSSIGQVFLNSEKSNFDVNIWTRRSQPAVLFGFVQDFVSLKS